MDLYDFKPGAYVTDASTSTLQGVIKYLYTWRGRTCAKVKWKGIPNPRTVPLCDLRILPDTDPDDYSRLFK